MIMGVFSNVVFFVILNKGSFQSIYDSTLCSLSIREIHITYYDLYRSLVDT
jgi:hypothetical protein